MELWSDRTNLAHPGFLVTPNPLEIVLTKRRVIGEIRQLNGGLATDPVPFVTPDKIGGHTLKRAL
jgi:hypothetical protein